VTPSPDEVGEPAGVAAAEEAVEVLLRFGAALLRAGQTAFETREWMQVIATKMGLAALSVALSTTRSPQAFGAAPPGSPGRTRSARRGSMPGAECGNAVLIDLPAQQP
jgi:hypothetical protein